MSTVPPPSPTLFQLAWKTLPLLLNYCPLHLPSWSSWRPHTLVIPQLCNSLPRVSNSVFDALVVQCMFVHSSLETPYYSIIIYTHSNLPLECEPVGTWIAFFSSILSFLYIWHLYQVGRYWMTRCIRLYNVLFHSLLFLLSLYILFPSPHATALLPELSLVLNSW